ncbi:MAG: macro domain-containing protein [Pseudomonadales bacterium]|nr:macro domain-containing protein [Candidatus Woesebacteria bacterium]MCB9801253.1 macro domain-containing protein [Pseudomonadales bacterium]
MQKKEFWKQFENQPTIVLIQGDITQEDTDAIVNTTTRTFEMAGGVDKAITEAAGPGMKEACAQYGSMEPSQVIITEGFNLNASYIIHTVGPVYGKEGGKEADLLAACYKNCLWMADRYNIRTISFPVISTGIYGYPMDEAAKVMARSIGGYFFDPENMNSAIEEIHCVVFTEDKYKIVDEVFEELFNRNDT